MKDGRAGKGNGRYIDGRTMKKYYCLDRDYWYAFYTYKIINQ
jgi:hypothetical protein